MTDDLARRAREIADRLPIAERLTVLARFGFMHMAAGDAEAARAVAAQIDDGLADAEDHGVSCPEVATELEALESWIGSASREKPDPRQDGIDLADQIMARPDALPQLAEIIRSGNVPSLGSRAAADAFEELCRRGEPARARALLDQISGSEAGHRARLRAGIMLKREPALGPDGERLIDEAIADAARMDRAEGKAAKRQFLAGIALMSFDDVDVAARIMRELHDDGHRELSAGVKQRLARGLLSRGQAEEALRLLASIRSDAARELATAALLDELAAASGLAAARALIAQFSTPAAVTSAWAKLAARAARDDPAQARADLAMAIGVLAAFRPSDPFFYTALGDLLSGYAAVEHADTAAEAAILGLLGPDSAFSDYRLRLTEYLAGALVARGRQDAAVTLAARLDEEAAAVMLMRASLP